MSPTHALLGLLARGERHGYELKRIIDQEFAPFWRIDFAQLYRSLAKMTRDGWVKARVERGAGGPDRKVYAVTTLGKRTLAAWLAEPARDRDEAFVKLRLAADAGGSPAPLIDQQRRALEDEHSARSHAHRAARETREAGRLILAHAALRETETSLAALDLYEAISPAARRRTHAPPADLTITGSDDPLLARLALLAHTTANVVGSIGGLLALAQHQADIAGVHLLDAATGEYNAPFVKHLLPEDDIVLVNLALRENGLIVARGNPKNLRGVRDLTRRGIRFINRQRGTGTRLLLHSKLRAARIDPHSLRDWERAASTHDAIAAAIATGAADVGPGLRAVAVEWGLDFIPLGEERYDLAMPRVEYESARLRPLLDALHSTEFRRDASTFQGYDLTRTGRVVARVK
ncbi:MAG TPA: substrate-binding domain-containing protein [Anaerolineae bacterium]